VPDDPRHQRAGSEVFDADIHQAKLGYVRLLTITIVVPLLNECVSYWTLYSNLEQRKLGVSDLCYQIPSCCHSGVDSYTDRSSFYSILISTIFSDLKHAGALLSPRGLEPQSLMFPMKQPSLLSTCWLQVCIGC